ncbi:RNA-directed DNA polymerase [Serratia marcescens]|uniref:antiviral reverse transcriptase Drt3b n=1 Tax=Serratia marcescens TaxID=615 RepID=UPI001F05D1AC|nr:antiviral reverse transcriptase Drt3b [Serratia marcescens]MDM1787140.1 RNA-directed DNA polymerase [Serratia marcescens]MDM1794440.1 RNA-directed DNA polymerase [Serratia marcescens]MDM1800506.1 RNA-directed DNA polymerase [Serratia marcescens]MDM1806210.1 RNA-directed DNA polymerase [Serratia marcescens]MDM1809714.1 RNA-directed DNA polymerase [Serratia marcescens]
MKKNRIRRSDYNRVLITETTPFETPIIFSNDGLYDQIATLDSADHVQSTVIKSLVLHAGISKPPNSTIPYTYKIKKDSKSFRRLALLHPASQWKTRVFYEKYEQLIIHYCSISPASIRAPKTVASSFYSKSSWENINKYKTGSIALDGLDKYVKHAPSFFSYRGYDRLYKFFNSRDYLALEKRFSFLKTLDVTKCFDSIYTHCLSWAVKDKPFTKSHVTVSSTFAQEFDGVIRHGNHNETNGIPIGPEVSRIFAEILFQEIDRRVIQELTDLKFGQHYEFRRYVDDVFIFARDESIANRIHDKYADVLIDFNLHTNTAKSTCIGRPFSSSKARLVYDAGQQANSFFEKFLEQTGTGVLCPKGIHNKWKLTKSYIDSVKALCHSNESTYDEIASFLISVITERVKRLVNHDDSSSTIQDGEYVDAFIVLLDVLFFLYSVAPSVGASYKLSTSLILAARFSKKHLPAGYPTVHQKIFDLTCSLLHDQCGMKHAGDIEGFVHLESFNIALATRELGDNHLLPPEIIDELFVSAGKLTYFTIVASLFYVRDSKVYEELRTKLLDAAVRKLSDLSDVLMNSEKAHLLLDLLSCPYVPDKQKSTWIKSLFKILQFTQPSKADLQSFLTGIGTSHAQVDWKDIDLLNSLEKKELKQAY